MLAPSWLVPLQTYLYECVILTEASGRQCNMRKISGLFSIYQDWVDPFFLRSPSVESGLIRIFLLPSPSTKTVSISLETIQVRLKLFANFQIQRITISALSQPTLLFCPPIRHSLLNTILFSLLLLSSIDASEKQSSVTLSLCHSYHPSPIT